MKHRIPETLEVAVDIVAARIRAEAPMLTVCLDAPSAEDFSASVHHGLGRTYRNRWEMWSPESPLMIAAKRTHGLEHADDVSGLVIQAAAARIRQHPFDSHGYVTQCRRHWASLGRRMDGKP